MKSCSLPGGFSRPDRHVRAEARLISLSAGAVQKCPALSGQAGKKRARACRSLGCIDSTARPEPTCGAPLYNNICKDTLVSRCYCHIGDSFWACEKSMKDQPTGKLCQEEMEPPVWMAGSRHKTVQNRTTHVGTLFSGCSWHGTWNLLGSCAFLDRQLLLSSIHFTPKTSTSD